MDVHSGTNGKRPLTTVAALFDELCLRWAREADVVVQQQGRLEPTLVLLPRDQSADEVAVRLEGLRGNLAERGAALVAELRPQTEMHDPAGLVFMTQMRLGDADQPDGVVVYVSLGAAAVRRALGYLVVERAEGHRELRRADTDPPAESFAWLDALIARPPPPEEF